MWIYVLDQVELISMFNYVVLGSITGSMYMENNFINGW